MKSLSFICDKSTICFFRFFKRVIYPKSGTKVGVFNKVTKIQIEVILN